MLVLVTGFFKLADQNRYHDAGRQGERKLQAVMRVELQFR
jgi:hypothetical protein